MKKFWRILAIVVIFASLSACAGQNYMRVPKTIPTNIVRVPAGRAPVDKIIKK